MAEGEASERVILQLRAVLRGISPLIWRRLLVPSDTSIAQLHDVLQVAFGWEDVHLHHFEIRGREYGLSRAGGSIIQASAASDSCRLVTLLDCSAQFGQMLFNLGTLLHHFKQNVVRVSMIPQPKIIGLDLPG
jgi:hypothetical protein